LETIREQMGATYGVSCFASIDYEPRQEFAVQIVCDTNEQQADDVVKAMIAEIEKIAAEGPLAEDIEKTREFLAKDHRNNLEQNGSWISYLNRYYSYKTDWVNGYEEALQAITYDDVKALAEKVLSSGNVLKVIMRPEVTAAE
ncbi:MAG: insulinase family protein, partial [Alistipes sp.]|nr:insulinase family protein [Alistipes sp.]